MWHAATRGRRRQLPEGSDRKRCAKWRLFGLYIDFLGFTHYWGKSRRGKWIIKRKTARQRLSRGLKRIAEWCRRNRHQPVAEQHKELSQKLRGHFAYYGITGNDLWLRKFRHGVKRAWQKWLHRRSRSSTDMPWDRFTRLLQRYRLPPARIVDSIYAAKP